MGLLQALRRLTPREQYDRAYRFKLASHSSVVHKPLPKEQWVSASEVSLLSICYFSLKAKTGYFALQDKRYLTPHVEDVLKENEERQVWDTMKVERK